MSSALKPWANRAIIVAMAAPASPVAPGEVLAGRYRCERVLGQGGMGVVVAAEHLLLGERVAVKFLLPEAASVPDVITRFQREARAAARIQSEHVARVMDVGVLDNGSPFLVMEYLEGVDLAAELETRGPLPIEEAVSWLLQASLGVAEAHSLGIVHRDLKPSNLFLARLANGRRVIKVLDFGIAKDAAAGSANLTHTFSALGSAPYMSPEQIRAAKGVDARSDVWSLGVTLYQLLTGRMPFEGETVTAIAAAISTDAPASLRELRPDVPPALESAIFGCLEKRREARVASVAALAQLLAPFGGRGAANLVARIAETAEVSPVRAELESRSELRPAPSSVPDVTVPIAQAKAPLTTPISAARGTAIALPDPIESAPAAEAAAPLAPFAARESTSALGVPERTPAVAATDIAATVEHLRIAPQSAPPPVVAPTDIAATRPVWSRTGSERVPTPPLTKALLGGTAALALLAVVGIAVWRVSTSTSSSAASAPASAPELPPRPSAPVVTTAAAPSAPTKDPAAPADSTAPIDLVSLPKEKPKVKATWPTPTRTPPVKPPVAGPKPKPPGTKPINTGL